LSRPSIHQGHDNRLSISQKHVNRPYISTKRQRFTTVIVRLFAKGRLNRPSVSKTKQRFTARGSSIMSEQCHVNRPSIHEIRSLQSSVCRKRVTLIVRLFTKTHKNSRGLPRGGLRACLNSAGGAPALGLNVICIYQHLCMCILCMYIYIHTHVMYVYIHIHICMKQCIYIYIYALELRV